MINRFLAGIFALAPGVEKVAGRGRVTGRLATSADARADGGDRGGQRDGKIDRCG